MNANDSINKGDMKHIDILENLFFLFEIKFPSDLTTLIEIQNQLFINKTLHFLLGRRIQTERAETSAYL
jgi:hypothetical protein